jgi:GAF domain-containing protein
MSLEDRIRSSVDTALEDLRVRVEADMHALVDQLLTAAAQERDEALQATRRAAFDEAWQTAQRDAAEQAARARTLGDQALAEARAEERANAERRIDEAVAATEARWLLAQRQSEAEAAVAANAIRSEGERRVRELAAAQSRLLESVRGLDGASTLSEVFDALALAVGREASRAAVLVVRHERLTGWKLSGFGARDAQPKAIDLGLSDQGVIGRAISQARAVTVDASDPATAPPPFVEPAGETEAVAVPVIVGGRVVAVVYGEAAAPGDRAGAPSGWTEAVEILARHSARCLEALTVQKTVAAAQPRFWVPAASASAPDVTESEGRSMVNVPSGTPA